MPETAVLRLKGRGLAALKQRTSYGPEAGGTNNFTAGEGAVGSSC